MKDNTEHYIYSILYPTLNGLRAQNTLQQQLTLAALVICHKVIIQCQNPGKIYFIQSMGKIVLRFTHRKNCNTESFVGRLVQSTAQHAILPEKKLPENRQTNTDTAAPVCWM